MRADKTRLEFIESIPFSCSTLCTLFTIIAPLVSRVKRVVSRSFILYYFPRNWRTQRAHAHFKSRDNSPIILVFLLLLRTRKKSSFDLLIILFFSKKWGISFRPLFFYICLKSDAANRNEANLRIVRMLYVMQDNKSLCRNDRTCNLG